MDIEFGTSYRDSITQFEGIATGRAEYMTGCTQIFLEPVADDNKPGEGRWVDIDRLEGWELSAPRPKGGPRAEAPVR